MKFRQRFLVLLVFFSVIFLVCLNSVLLPGLLETFSDYQLENIPLEYKGKGDASNKGLVVKDVWGLPSLGGISEKDRVEFAKLYNDDRFFFGDGREYHDILSKDTEPYKDPDISRNAELTLSKDRTKSLVKERILKSPDMRSVDNLRKLAMAADMIKSQSNITKEAFRSMLRVNKRIRENVRPVENYEDKFSLSRKERKVLVKAISSPPAPKMNSPHENDRLHGALSRRIRRTSKWYKFFKQISRTHMYHESTLVDDMLQQLSERQATKLYFSHGTRFHAEIILSAKYPAQFTPIRFSRTQELRLNQRHQDDFQRHVSEIAAFHLDRALGFRRAVPTTGRIFNINAELRSIYHGPHKLSLFVVSLEGNDCIMGRCQVHCGSNEIICGTPDTIESSMAVDLQFFNMTSWPYPWREPEAANETAVWIHDPLFCDRVRAIPTYSTGRRLLDLIDLAVFDFLQGNRARTKYQTFTYYGEDTFIIHNENEMGFGRAFQDEPIILTPLFQCCLIRRSTLRTLMDYVLGPTKLSEIMRTSLSKDPIAPVLLKQHLLALDRRLKIALKVTYECIRRNGYEKVVIPDGF